MTPKARAEASADAMWAGDAASKWVGMELLDVGEGTATMALTIAGHHANGHGICHGGVIFALADSAFAFACNSRNDVTVAQHNSISYLAPAHVGDRLRAVATEVALVGRSGLTDVAVRRDDGAVIAQFRGASRAIGGHLFQEAT